MAKQLNLLATDRIIPTPLHSEMQRSYLEYAMSVIVGRALPDVRDGLKPVHRRIIYAMHELGLTPDRPFRKCARVVGDVLGKYHPHGDQAVYDALVRLVQDFSSRYPLLSGHGNFGSVDNDPPAAMRYTETRLAAISQEGLLSEIGEATVDFLPNFDNSQQEPTVLPAQLPILLLNGCSGIAVGMATNIPPHNLGEIVDGLIALIDHPDLSDQQLLKLIPGPDFPTGGEIVGVEGIKEAYLTGKGSIPLRGVATLEEITRQSTNKTKPTKSKIQNRTAIVVTELPYQVNKAAWIEKMAELVNNGKIEGIADLRDESDREGMRVVIELKRDINPQLILDQLYRQTALQTNFGAILLALVDGQPRQLTLRQLLEQFLIFREQTLNKQYTYDLQQAEKRLHIVDGLVKALNQLDALITILRNAPDGSSAKITLQSQLNISEIQADAILAMPLRRITGLEKQHLQTELGELNQQIELLQRLLNDRHELLKALKKDLRSLKRKYADARRTKLINGNLTSPVKEDKKTMEKEEESTEPKSKSKNHKSPETLLFTAPIPEEEVILEFTNRGYVRRLPKADAKSTLKSNDDFIVRTEKTTTKDELVVIIRNGKAYPLKVSEIPTTVGHSKGTPLLSLLPNSVQTEFITFPLEAIASSFFLNHHQKDVGLILFTEQGKIKRLPLEEIGNLTTRGMTLIKLKDNDQLKYVSLAKEKEEVILATSGGRILRFSIDEQQLPLMGKTAQGMQAVRLRQKEQLVDCCTLQPNQYLLVVSQQGYARHLAVNTIRLANRGDIGTQALHFTAKTDMLAGMISAPAATEVILITSNQRMIRLAINTINFSNKDGTGDRILELNTNEKVISVVNC